jgi:DNA helicase-2/ATP-dependent DNA helicase PcrA
MFTWAEGDLNADQEAAIREPGSVFLIACPGSGKTQTLTYKIAEQLSKLESDKQRVIAITYTHRAADEIHERVEYLGVDTSKLWIGTIHSFCLEWILKPYAIYHDALKCGFRAINAHDSERILTELCKPYKNPRVTYWDCGHYYTSTGRRLSCLQSYKHGAIDDVLDQYFAHLTSNHQIDFELILSYAYELLVANPTISILLSSLFSCILVDEYQDTKEIQYVIIASILKAGDGKVRAFIVGDPNQAIYGSLGGYAITRGEFQTVAGIELKQLELSRNYRSSKRIIEYFGNYNERVMAIVAAAEHKDYGSLISFDATTRRDNLDAELVRLIKHNIEVAGIAPNEVCILAPQWVHLASMTRKLVAALPEYSFDGPGMVPFARDIDNFWYKLSKIILTEASPRMYVRRYRWAGEILSDLEDAGVDVSTMSRKDFLRHCNSLSASETDGLTYLGTCFEALFNSVGIDFHSIPALLEHYEAFFDSSRSRIERLKQDGAEFIDDIKTFRKVFEIRTGITVSTIHGVKGAEYDAVIAYALLEGMVPHFSDPDGQASANRLLYVICSRARKNLHLIAEQGRFNGIGEEYVATNNLSDCAFGYDSVP